MASYIIGIDQSTQGTKALLFDENARLLARTDLPHEQKISPEGHVSHDLEEIYRNTVAVVKSLLSENGVSPKLVKGVGISNQRETTAAWDRATGKPVCDAVVWQCSRAGKICEGMGEPERKLIAAHTGIPLSPYFPAAKMAWILQNCARARELAAEGRLCLGTVDSWLLFRLTGGKEFRTDYSNASRTQLFNLHTLTWDEDVCGLFGIQESCLPAVCDTNALFGVSGFEGTFAEPVPIHSMIGDSHGALFGQGCLEKGMVKATYGTGSSIMMNIGTKFASSGHGLVTSLAWGLDGRVDYVLEGNLNYTGAVITWLKEDLKLISSAGETEKLARTANPSDTAYLVPAFSGLGAPYWNSGSRAMLCGMSRTTGRAEVVRAALESIAYQITDIVGAMEQDCGRKTQLLSVDGGPTRNGYLMQFQSDMARVKVKVPEAEELSGIGAAYIAGLALGLYAKEQIFSRLAYTTYAPEMEAAEQKKRYEGWKDAVGRALI